MKKEIKNHWVKWYWQDYLAETGLRMCSLAARGLWVEMLAIMSMAKRMGCLEIGDKAVDTKMLAKLVNEDENTVQKLLSELEFHNVFSRSKKGTIYCRRLVREADISRKRALAASVRWQKNLHMQKRCKKNAKVMQTDMQNVYSASASAYAYDSNNKERGGVGEKEKEIIRLWNEFAQRHGLPTIKGVVKDSKRERHLRARIRDEGFNFQELLNQVEKSPFLLGQKTDFRATFDWIIAPSNYQKIMEGNYIDRPSSNWQAIEAWAKEEK